MQLDDPARHQEIRDIIRRKPSLRLYYSEVYRKYRESLARCPKEGIALELGSGCGFAKEEIPGIVTSDVIPYPGVDRVIDGTRMELPDSSLRFLCMQNVLHHIPDAEAFFREASRCLLPGGRIFIVDQYAGWPSRWIYKYAHHEPFHPEADDWKFASQGPLSDANGALAGIIFERDREKFSRLFPKLELVRYSPHTPLRYWLTGGLKSWSALPGWAFPAATALDSALARLSPKFASFVDIELVRKV